MPRLIVTRGPDEGRQFPLAAGAAVTVGRHSANPVPLRDPQVSRRHFDLTLGPDGARLSDLGSGNGTRVNGRPVQAVHLQFGDEIAAGETVMLFAADPAVTLSGSTRTHVARSFDPVEADAPPVVKAVFLASELFTEALPG